MSQTVVVAAPPGLSSPAVYVFAADADTVLNTGGDTLAPGTNATGKYTATIAETLNGWHYYEVRVSSTVIRNGFAKLTDGGTIYLGEITSTEVAAVQSGLSTLTESGVRTAVGMSSANLDTQLAAIAAYIDTEVAAIKAKTDNLPAAPAATGDIPTVSQIWTTALTEAYRGTGATGTAAQLLYEILQNLTEFAIASTTKTVKKLDGSTTAKTYTLNSATTPTSITEAT